MHYFNPKNFGFYAEADEGFIELSDEEYRALLDGQSQGKEIALGEGGKPYLKLVVVTPEEVIATAKAKRDSLLSVAASRIAPLQDAVDLDDATDDEVALLKKWKQYRVAVNRVDLSSKPISWPVEPA